MSRSKKLGGRVVRWAWRSWHRVCLTRELSPVVAAYRGTVLDIGGGRDSPLAAAWAGGARRVRLDIVTDFGPEVQGDAGCLPVADASVDGVLLSEVLEHIPDPQAVMTEVARVLRPGAVFAGSVPFLGQGLHADPNDYYRYTDQALRRLLGEFRAVQVTPHGNAFGVGWRLVLMRLRFLVVLNPLLRHVGRWPDRVSPEGYTFVARR